MLGPLLPNVIGTNKAFQNRNATDRYLRKTIFAFQQILIVGCGEGLMVSVLPFYYDKPSLNPAETYCSL